MSNEKIIVKEIVEIEDAGKPVGVITLPEEFIGRVKIEIEDDGGQFKYWLRDHIEKNRDGDIALCYFPMMYIGRRARITTIPRRQ